jgi:hypothetical protein
VGPGSESSLRRIRQQEAARIGWATVFKPKSFGSIDPLGTRKIDYNPARVSATGRALSPNFGAPLLAIAIGNQWPTLTVLQTEIQRQQQRLLDDNELISGQFADQFEGLTGRIWWDRVALGGVAHRTLIILCEWTFSIDAPSCSPRTPGCGLQSTSEVISASRS